MAREMTSGKVLRIVIVCLVLVVLVGMSPAIVKAEVLLPSSGSISGVVENESGNPIQGAWVYAYGESGKGAHTGADGSYSITSLVAGGYVLSAEASGYATEYYDNVYAWSSATLVMVADLNDTPNTDFTLGPGVSISGVAEDESGDPIAGAWVCAEGDSFGDYYTGADGIYVITDLAPGSHTVWVEASGYASEYYDDVYDLSAATPVPVTLQNDTPNIDFALASGGSISGMVEDESGDPIEGAMVYVSEDPWGRDYTGAEGSYSITGLAAGGYVVGAKATDYSIKYYDDVYNWCSATPVTVTGSTDTANIDFALSPGVADATPPTTPVVTDDGATTASTSTIHAIWSSSDTESCVAEYQYAIGTTPGGTDLADWTSVGTDTEVTKTGLSLAVGTTYYFAVKAKNGQDLWSAVGVSDGMAVVEDATPPVSPEVTDDGAGTSSTSELHASWSSSDPESGIVEYQYAIGTTPGGTDLADWTSVGTDTQVTKTGLSLAAGTNYYFAVKAKNGQNLWSGVGVSDGIEIVTPVDATPPLTPVVTDDGTATSSTSELHATWSSSDPESGIAEYQYAIGTTPGGTDLTDWTPVGTDTQVTKTGLSLAVGTACYFAVKAKSGQDLWSGAGVSDGIAVVAEGTVQEEITPAGGAVQSTDGEITAEFPANAADGTLTVTIKYIASPSDKSTPQGFKACNTYFVIEVADASGNAVVNLSQPVTITVKYSPEDVAAAGGDPSNLVLAYCDETATDWKPLDTTVNTIDQTLSTTTTYPGTWAVLAKATENNGAPLWIWIMAAVAVLLGGGLGTYLVSKKRAVKR